MCLTSFQYGAQVATEYIYLHWPFCPYKCTYCPFVAFAGLDKYMDQYHQALMHELDWFDRTHQGDRQIKTIFIGGGTPSTYPDHLLLDMSGKLKEVFNWNTQLEFSIEVNPGTVRPEQLQLWKGAGINRLSIGVQSLNERVLQRLNRQQSVADVRRLLDQASIHFDNLSVDIIVGLPDVSEADWGAMIDELVTWPIQHVSMYFLSLHENTPLYRGVSRGDVLLPADEWVVEQYYMTVERFKQAGLHQYELSNFARSGFESRHNQAYWERQPYRGFGVGACSFDGSLRFQNEKNLLKYFKSLDSGCTTFNFVENLSREQIWLEQLMLGMRSAKGVDLIGVQQYLTEMELGKFELQLKILQEAEFILVQDGRLYLTPKGLSIENEVVVRLSI